MKKPFRQAASARRRMLLSLGAAALVMSRLALPGAVPVRAVDNVPEQAPLHIGICLDDHSDYADCVREGYRDALTDALGEDHVVFAEQTAEGSASPATAAETLIQANSELIFAYGSESLDAAASVSTTVPIVFGGVIDYRNVLHLLPASDASTGRNVTGIAGKAASTAALSLLIEACDNHPNAVGIFYDPADTNTILQNERFEAMLDEAGIPWREYEVQTPQAAEPSPDTNTAREIFSIPLPSITAAASGKEGPNIHPDSIGDNGDLTGINEPMSARTPQASLLWKKNLRVPDSFEENLALACRQCDCLYFCADNELAHREDFGKMIFDSCLASGTASVACDPEAGQYTLVSLYVDPYDLGYECGKMSVSVLDDPESIREMPVKYPDPNKTTKLYNPKMSYELGKNWPKSFHEREEYLKNYEPGQLTERE